MQEIDQPISWDELKPAVIKLTKNKVPGLNRVPTNNFKALNDGNLTHLLDFFNKHWMEEIDFDEWNEGQSVPVPKSGDLYDPKNISRRHPHGYRRKHIQQHPMWVCIQDHKITWS